MATVRWPRRPWRRFWFLEPQLGRNAVLGRHGPLLGAAGVVSMAIFGSSELGQVNVSTYRGRPPGHAELEEVQSFNMTGTSGPLLAYTDGAALVDGHPVEARIAFVAAGEHDHSDRWAVLLFGAGYSASISLAGLPPDRLALTMTADDRGYTDMRTAMATTRLETVPRPGPTQPMPSCSNRCASMRCAAP